MEQLSFVFSTLGLAVFIISFLVKGSSIRKLLMLNVTGNLLIAISYLCIGNYNGILSSMIGVTMGAINSFITGRGKSVPKWLLGIYAAAFIGVNLSVWTGWTDIFAVLACMTAVLIVSSSNGTRYRLWSVLNNALWCIFDVLRGSWGPLVSHVILTAFTIVGVLLHDFKKGKKA